jgi:hypothetical protein
MHQPDEPIFFYRFLCGDRREARQCRCPLCRRSRDNRRCGTVAAEFRVSHPFGVLERIVFEAKEGRADALFGHRRQVCQCL